MTLYLVQHGKSLPKQEDPEQGLSMQGKSEVERIAKVAQSYSLQVSIILHSDKKRARQTAQIMADYLQPKNGVQEEKNLGALDDISIWAENAQKLEKTMLVGHLPFMQKLLACLVAKDEQKQILKFQNGGIVCLNQEEDSPWHIKWTLMPNIQ